MRLSHVSMQITESQVRISDNVQDRASHWYSSHRDLSETQLQKLYSVPTETMRVHCPSPIHPGWQRVLRRRGRKVEQFPSVRTLHPIVRLQRRTARRNEAIELKGLGGLRESVHQFATAGGY